MADHREQIQRIREKLTAARKADKKLNAFGAASHEYRIDRPASESDVRDFEERYSLVLPGCYRAFITGVGNGGPSYRDSGAGPFYGIYPLGESVDEILDNPAPFLNSPAVIVPDMTDEEWSTLTSRLYGDDEDDISDAQYEAELGKIYAGLLPIGSQGCTYLHALVLNGPNEGSVVNLDIDGQKPKFAFEKNFLDWYERWLDEVILGYLTQEAAYWFGLTMGGDDVSLMRVFANSGRRETRVAALMGLAKLTDATDESCRKLRDLCDEQDTEIRHLALRMLTKFAYPMAREPLRTHINGSADDCLAGIQSIHWYASKQSKEWVDLLRARLSTVDTPKTFRFLSYLLVASQVDFSTDFSPFIKHEQEDIRVTTFYSFGKLKNKKALVDLFIEGLDDPSPRVVHAVLQALEGVRDRKLLKAYARVRDRFKTDEHYVLTNLRLRLKEVEVKSVEPAS